MLQNSYKCPWCKADLRGMKIPTKTSQEYYDGATYLTTAIELWTVGYECIECNSQWKYDGHLIREGIPELKDKYKIEEITEKSNDELVFAENTTTENDSENNNNLNNESEEN